MGRYHEKNNDLPTEVSCLPKLKKIINLTLLIHPYNFSLI